jgi:hypothetical protein
MLECVAHRLIARLYFETEPERYPGLRVPLQVGERAAGAEVTARPFRGKADGLLRSSKGLS